MPDYTAFMGLAFFASLGLPGLAGFIGEFMVFIGAFPVFRPHDHPAATGVIITAAYYLWAIQRMFLGKLNPSLQGLPGPQLARARSSTRSRSSRSCSASTRRRSSGSSTRACTLRHPEHRPL